MEMKRFPVLLMAAALAACGGTAEPVTAPAVETAATAAPAALTVTDALKAFEAAGLAVSNVEEMTAESDTNSLLGRPGQYTGKVNWVDERHAEVGAGNTVEAFATEADLQRRKEYIEQVTAGTPFLLQYIVAHRNLLLRLDKALTPDEAAAYEAALKSL